MTESDSRADTHFCRAAYAKLTVMGIVCEV